MRVNFLVVVTFLFLTNHIKHISSDAVEDLARNMLGNKLTTKQTPPGGVMVQKVGIWSCFLKNQKILNQINIDVLI